MSRAEARKIWAEDEPGGFDPDGSAFAWEAPAPRVRPGDRTPARRRTVTITGRPDLPDRMARLYEFPARAAVPAEAVETAAPPAAPVPRPAPRRTVERLSVAPRPDRVAMWAVLLAVFLVLVAALSSHAG
jgi:hypothetical protein